MYKACFRAAFVMLLLAAAPLAGWSQASQNGLGHATVTASSEVILPTHGEIVAAIATASRIYTEFGRLTDQIDFNSWNAPYGSQRSARLELETMRNRLDQDQAIIASLKSSPTAAASQLFVAFFDLDAVGHTADDLASSVSEFSSEVDLATDLYETSSHAESAATTLVNLFQKQMSLEERELAAEQVALQGCRAQAH